MTVGGTLLPAKLSKYELASCWELLVVVLKFGDEFLRQWQFAFSPVFTRCLS